MEKSLADEAQIEKVLEHIQGIAKVKAYNLTGKRSKELNAVIDRGFDPVFGARPLKRYLQSKVETLIARRVIAADVAPGTELVVDLDENGEIVIR